MKISITITCMFLLIFPLVGLTFVDAYTAENGLIAYWESNGTDYIEIGGSQSIAVNITSQASITRSASLSITSTNSKLAVTPTGPITVNNLEPNVPQTIYFSATNLGVEEQISNIELTIISRDTYTGQERARTTLHATLLATLVQKQTDLEVLCLQQGTNNPAIGVEVELKFADQSQTQYTDTNGKTVFDLRYPHGGGFAGAITLSSKESKEYYAGETTTFYVNFGSNTCTLEINAKNSNLQNSQQPATVDWTLIIISVIIAVTILGCTVLFMRRKK